MKGEGCLGDQAPVRGPPAPDADLRDGLAVGDGHFPYANAHRRRLPAQPHLANATWSSGSHRRGAAWRPQLTLRLLPLLHQVNFKNLTDGHIGDPESLKWPLQTASLTADHASATLAMIMSTWKGD
jgi:hypothetical protein